MASGQLFSWFSILVFSKQINSSETLLLYAEQPQDWVVPYTPYHTSELTGLVHESVPTDGTRHVIHSFETTRLINHRQWNLTARTYTLTPPSSEPSRKEWRCNGCMFKGMMVFKRWTEMKSLYCLLVDLRLVECSGDEVNNFFPLRGLSRHRQSLSFS